jgi:hypothetical protein
MMNNIGSKNIQLSNSAYHIKNDIGEEQFPINIMLDCVNVYLLLLFAFTFTFPTFLDRCLLGTLALLVAFAPLPTILNIFPPHTVHIPEIPLRPFFVLTRCSFFISRLTLHFTQYPSVVNLRYFSC